MEKFLRHYSDAVTGVLACFDRIIFKGHLPLGWPDAMEGLLARQGLRIVDFKRFVPRQAERIRRHAEAVARHAGRPFIYLSGRQRKEDLARRIAARDGIQQGLICVLRAVEPCRSYKVVAGKGRPQLQRALRKCLCFYFYYLDREFGMLHVRLEAWFPLTIQIALNGHEWLARKLDRHGITYRKCDNAFLAIADPARAQKLADRFVRKNWPRVLEAFARRVNPLLADLLVGMKYYWVTDQAEYATDVLFRSRETLKPLYDNLLRHATLCFSAEDVLTFLGRKLHGSFQGEVLTDSKRKRWPGARVKHRMKENWMKMYDKHGSVLRVETVINQPREFKVRRRGVRQGREVIGWFPMAKGVANLFRYAQVARAANRRYLNALAGVVNPAPARQSLRQLAHTIRRHGRTYRGFNPADAHDLRLFAAVLRGEHALHGFRNADVRRHLFGASRPPQSRRDSQRVSRLLRRLHAHALIAKIPRTRRWRMTQHGSTTLASALLYFHDYYPETLASKAA